MPGKNKQQKNAFWFYMQDLMVELRREGRVFNNGMADVVPIAHPRFKALPEKDKERYDNMAKEYKRRMRGQPGDAIRQDNVGNIVANRRDEISDYEREREKEIKGLMRNWPVDITEEVFYVIDVQSLCKTTDDQYLPVEIAVLGFSLKEGIIKSYHQFLRPGGIPKGMRYECMSKSEETHQIAVEGHPDASNNFLSVQNVLQNFVNPEGRAPHYPPVFALREEWQKVDYTLEYIRHQSCLGARAAPLKVYELESLFIAMVEHGSVSGNDKNAAPSKIGAAEVLTSAAHDYHRGLKCQYHEDLECKHCSLLWVRKFCYAIVGAMTEIYSNYELKPRTHLPTLKDHQFNVAMVEDAVWTPRMAQDRSVQSSFVADEPTYKLPANMPKTNSVLAPKMGKPAPVFRPPGAAELDHGKNKYPDVRYWPQGGWRAPVPSPYSIASTTEPSPEPSDEEKDDLPSIPSQNVALSQGRAATWVPNAQSRGSWSRRTTPASTPRATPMATPVQTPRHSPPRDTGSHFPDAFVRRNEMMPPTNHFPTTAPPAVNPPPGLRPAFGRTGAENLTGSIFGAPPPGFRTPIVHGSFLESGIRAAPPPGWGGVGDNPTSVVDDFPSLSIQSPGKGRGRGSALRK